jgi:hypothetical protein
LRGAQRRGNPEKAEHARSDEHSQGIFRPRSAKDDRFYLGADLLHTQLKEIKATFEVEKHQSTYKRASR